MTFYKSFSFPTMGGDSLMILLEKNLIRLIVVDCHLEKFLYYFTIHDERGPNSGAS